MTLDSVAVVMPKLESVVPSTMVIAQRIAQMHPETLKTLQIQPFTDMYEARTWVRGDGE